MKLNKEKFLKTEVGAELKNCIRVWDNAIDELRKVTPGWGDPDAGLGFSYWDNTCRCCQAQWEVYKMVLLQFFGVEYCFTRTDEYFGLVTSDEENWLFKIERAAATPPPVALNHRRPVRSPAGRSKADPLLRGTGALYKPDFPV